MLVDDRRDLDRRPARLDRRLLPRLGRHGRLPRHRDHDGVPGAALHHRARLDGRRPAQRHHASAASSAQGVFTLVLVFTLFGWFYPARIVRAVVLSLREKEFVEAARMVGSSDWRIIRSHILPHLVAPIIVYSTLAVASFILGEAGLSFLGVGIKLPTRELGEPAPAGDRLLHARSRG